MNQQFSSRLAAIKSASWRNTLHDIRRGIERETLRLNPDGSLAQTDHPQSLGSALTHPLITTDFSESLLEFITPATNRIETTLAQLADIHRFAARKIGEERLGASSIPGFLRDQDEIRLAQYGSSNIGKMKTLYRQGLKNRYGSMMQAISGVHFNFSLPESFWQPYQQLLGEQQPLQDFISAQYLHLIRNYKRYVWLIVYLFGASPALCSSFLQGRPPRYNFQQLGKDSLYLPYATSLRMSDLGYTNSAQSSLAITYNCLHEYIAGLHSAITTPSSEYADIGTGQDAGYQQLNGNILQIENEFYSTIRPKRTIQSGERPTCALAKRGVEYIEVRALDVNPFSVIGITESQIRFMDVFLVYCLLADSPVLSAQQQAVTEQNLKAVVTDGRRLNLELLQDGQPRLMQDWAEELFAGLQAVAVLLDDSCESGQQYQSVLKQCYLMLLDPAQTLSGQMLNTLLTNRQDHATANLQLAALYRQQLLSSNYQFYTEADFTQMAADSLAQQQQLEQADQLSFDAYLQQYFEEKPC